jgi:hypothetical protein
LQSQGGVLLNCFEYFLLRPQADVVLILELLRVLLDIFAAFDQVALYDMVQVEGLLVFHTPVRESEGEGGLVLGGS